MSFIKDAEEILSSMNAAQNSTKETYAKVIETSNAGLISGLEDAAKESIAEAQSAQLKDDLQ